MSRANYKEITQWFSLDKYDYILGLSVRHSMAEVFMMNYRYERLEYEKEDEFLAIPFPMIPDINSFDEEVGDGQLSYDGRGIIPINFGLLCETVNSFISDGRIKVLPSGQIVPADGMGGKDIYYQPMRYEYDDPTSDGLTGILTDIGLDIMNDDEILASLKVLLKKWRNQTGIEEPKENDRRRFGGSTIAKIYNYRVLAYFDIAR